MVDRELFERYEKALGANAELFSIAVKALSGEVDGMGSSEMREYLGERYPSLVRAYGTVAAEAASEFYDTQRAMAGGAEAFGEYETVTAYPEWLDAESAAQVNAVSAGVRQAVASIVYDFLEARGMKSVMGCADSTLDYNASHDPAHPKWALVPHAGACAWCVMLGSRGFAYQSERTVGASRHNRCKCTPIVDFDVSNPKLKGYDPGKLLKEYEAREESGETHFRQRRPTKRRRYDKKGKKKTVSAQNSHAQAAKLIDYLSKAESARDFQLRALKVDEQWRASKHEGNAFRKLRSSYVEMAGKWGVDPNVRPDPELQAVHFGKNLSAAAYRPKVELYRDVDGKKVYARFAQDSDLSRIKQIAGKGTGTPVHEAKGITADIEKTKGVHVNPSEWKQYRGVALVEFPDGEVHECEIHWFYSKQTGKIKYHMKKDFDDPITRY